MALRISQVVSANTGWRVALVNEASPEDQTKKPVLELAIAAWAFVEGEDDEHPEIERREDYVQRLLPLANFGNALQNPTALPQFLGIVEPGRNIKDLYPIARQRRARLAAERKAERVDPGQQNLDGKGVEVVADEESRD